MATSEPPKIRKKKKDVTITMSPYLKAQIDKIVESENFTSVSELATQALIEFIVKYNLELENKTAISILIRIIQTSEGRALITKLLSKQEIDTLNIVDPYKE